MTFTFRNCRLIPELSGEIGLTMADVLVADGNIVDIVPAGTGSCGDQELDIHGKTLLPGLIDMHVHLFSYREDAWGNTAERIAVQPRRALDCLLFAQFLLDLGFTTIRDVGDEEHFPSFAVRDAINEGQFVGPTIYGSGVIISGRAAGFEGCDHAMDYISNPFEMRREVRNQFAHGADFIKLYGTGSMLAIDSLPDSRLLEIDEIREAVQIAERKGSYVASHCHGAEGIDVMIDCGVHTIEHASFITEESCKKLDGRKDVGIVPTLACSSREMNELEGHPNLEFLDQANIRRNACIKNAYENHDILMGWGTDFSMPSQKKRPFIEWKIRKEELNMKNLDLLKQATINGAILMRLEDKIGSVQIGKQADLIVVDGKPDEDITVMYQKPAHVMKNGVLVR